MIYLNTDSESNDEKNGIQQNDILHNGVSLIKSKGRTIALFTIIGQIEGHYKLPQDNKTTCYEHLIPLLVSAECSEAVEGVLVVLNTVGGDVEAGLAIAEIISGMKTPTVSLVLGGAHSIGIPLAVSADRSLVAKTATLTVHPVRINGLVLATKQSFDVLHDMQERIIAFVCSESNISESRFRELMLKSDELSTDTGTVLSGSDAVREGLLDSTATLSEALEELEKLIISAKHD